MEFRQLFTLFFHVFLVFTLIEEARSQAPRGNCPRPKLKNGRAKVRSRGAVVYFRCRRNFILIGNRFATCIGGKWSDSAPICAGKECAPPKITAIVSMELSNSNSIATFNCAPGYIMHGPSTAVCMGKVWNGTAPQCLGPDGIYGMDCTFENNFRCGWTQDRSDHFDWRMQTGATQTSDTGPSYDHTLGQGKSGTYLYIETSMPRLPNDTARLLSPVFGQKYSYSCFEFWYHLYGRVGVGELRVYVRTVDKDLDELEPRFEIAGNQGDVWKKGMITIEILEKPFQIVIEAKRLNTYFSDIAVDDLKIGRCPPGVDPTTPSVPVSFNGSLTTTVSPLPQTSATGTSGSAATTSTKVLGTTGPTQPASTAVTTQRWSAATSAVTQRTNSAGTSGITTGGTTTTTSVTQNTKSATTPTATKVIGTVVATATTQKTKPDTSTRATEKTRPVTTTMATQKTRPATTTVTQKTKPIATTMATQRTKQTATTVTTQKTRPATTMLPQRTRPATTMVTQKTKPIATTVTTQRTRPATTMVTQKTKPIATTIAMQRMKPIATTMATQRTKPVTTTMATQKTKPIATSMATQRTRPAATTMATQKTKPIATTMATQRTRSATSATTKDDGEKAVTKSSGTGIVVYKPTKVNKTSNEIDENAKDNTIKVDSDNTINSFPRTAEVSSDSSMLTYPVTIYVALSVVGAFAVIFVVVGLVGYAVQRRRRRMRRESQISEELKTIISGDTLMEQWLSWRIYDTVE